MNDWSTNRALRDEIEQQAAHYVVLLDETEDAHVRQTIFDWINGRPDHAVAFAAAHATWAKSARIRDDAGDGRDELDQPASAPLPVAKTRINRRSAILAMMAATAAGGVGMAWHFNQLRDRYRTRHGERTTAHLNDGSSITLNGDTMLDVKMEQGRRMIRLSRGEALFDVARDPARPFVIDLDGTQIRVLGTKFNVRQRKDMIELSVTEGRVSVSAAGNQSIEVGAGSTAQIRPGIVTTTIDDPQLVQQRISWSEGFLEFDDQPLDEVIEEFNRYRAEPMIIGDPRIASTMIAGRFGIDESNDFIEALQASFGIFGVKRNGVLILEADHK